MTQLLSGRQNLSITIFVPADCTNRCNFCTSKIDYDTHGCRFDSVVKKIKKLRKTSFVKKNVDSFVLTGGEPFADLVLLEQLINEIPKNKKIYINTTLPTHRYSEEELAAFINNHRINGINISRHQESLEEDKQFFNEQIASDSFVSKIQIPVKINILAKEETIVANYLKRWDDYSNVRLSFRADYRTVTPASLRQLSDEFLAKIYQMENVSYVGHGGCDVCFDVGFQTKNGFYFSYHRGLESSSIEFGDHLQINDILIFQDGRLAYDWDREKRLKVKNKTSMVKKEQVKQKGRL